MRVGGGVPIALRAAALTADAARNGFGLRLFAAIRFEALTAHLKHVVTVRGCQERRAGVPGALCRCVIDVMSYSVQRLNTRHPFVPPKPKELDIA